MLSAESYLPCTFFWLDAQIFYEAISWIINYLLPVSQNYLFFWTKLRFIWKGISTSKPHSSEIQSQRPVAWMPMISGCQCDLFNPSLCALMNHASLCCSLEDVLRISGLQNLDCDMYSSWILLRGWPCTSQSRGPPYFWSCEQGPAKQCKMLWWQRSDWVTLQGTQPFGAQCLTVMFLGRLLRNWICRDCLLCGVLKCPSANPQKRCFRAPQCEVLRHIHVAATLSLSRGAESHLCLFYLTLIDNPVNSVFT